MHRTLRRPWMLVGGLLVLLLGGVPANAPAQICSPAVQPLAVLLNSTTRLQMSSRKPIKSITNPKEGLLTIRTVERDPTTVLLVGTAPGLTRLEMEDADGNKEFREVLIQADVEYLTSQLKRGVPLAQICVVPNGANSVILTGYVHRAEDIAVAQAIAQSVGFTVINGLRLDGVAQVQLDVVVARVERTKGRDFGFNFLQNSKQELFGSTVGNLIPAASSTVGLPGSALQPAQFGNIITSAPSQANLFSGVITSRGGFLGFLQALETEGLAKLLTQPRLVTLSGNAASFLDGGEQAVPVPAGLGQVGVQFEEFGTRLNFLPIVLGNGRIHLEVEPEVSSLNAAAGVSISGASVPGRQTQRVHTTVELESGQTFVIGGLIQRTLNGTTNKVPVLGQLPFLGVLFSTKVLSEDETELVILVTPHLVDAQSCDQLTKVLPGQESRTPDDFELFLEGILEAPRGPREVFQGTRYVPAFRSGPTAGMFPCAGHNDGIHAQDVRPGGYAPSCGANGCGATPATSGALTVPPDLVPTSAAAPRMPVAAPDSTPTPQPESLPYGAPSPQGGPLSAETPNPQGGSLSAMTPSPLTGIPPPPVTAMAGGQP